MEAAFIWHKCLVIITWYCSLDCGRLPFQAIIHFTLSSHLLSVDFIIRSVNDRLCLRDPPFHSLSGFFYKTVWLLLLQTENLKVFKFYNVFFIYLVSFLVCVGYIWNQNNFSCHLKYFICFTVVKFTAMYSCNIYSNKSLCILAFLDPYEWV